MTSRRKICVNWSYGTRITRIGDSTPLLTTDFQLDRFKKLTGSETGEASFELNNRWLHQTNR